MSGPSPNMSCIFPFKYNGITYQKCTNDGDKGWCATSVDESGELVDFTKYGFCEQGCNLKIGKKDFIKSIIGLLFFEKWKCHYCEFYHLKIEK